MSYEKIIGFGKNPEEPKGPMRPLNTQELGYFRRMGVAPFFIDLDTWMPEKNREPEPKIFVDGVKGFQKVRALINASQNAFIIPDQAYRGKHPLTSLLIDTNPAATLDPHNLSLRYRFETDPETGLMSRADFNEKSGMVGGVMIGGCIDRYERELAQKPGQSAREAYDAFVQKYRDNNDRAFCDQVSFDNLRVGAGYICARNEVGFAVKHPTDDVMFVFELCEDIWHDTTPDITSPVHKYYEVEFEFKQAWGQLPSKIKTPDDFKRYVYETMTMVQQYLHINTPGSTINMKSKAEIAKENFQAQHGVDPLNIIDMGMTTVFDYATKMGGEMTLEQTMRNSGPAIFRMGNALFKEMERYNNAIDAPNITDIGYGSRTICANNDNRRPSSPIAALK